MTDPVWREIADRFVAVIFGETSDDHARRLHGSVSIRGLGTILGRSRSVIHRTVNPDAYQKQLQYMRDYRKRQRLKMHPAIEPILQAHPNTPLTLAAAVIQAEAIDRMTAVLERIAAALEQR